MNVHFLTDKKTGLLVFLLLLGLVYFFLQFHVIALYEPGGIHFIRQVDSLNFIKYYRDHGMHFFHTGSYCLDSTDGRGACEFPLMYYMIAAYENVFGENIFLLRWIYLAITTLGLLAFYRAVNERISFWPLAIALTFILYGSAIIVYYANNYLPDTCAWGFMLIGFYAAGRYVSEQKRKWLLIGFLVFTWAALLKPTFLITYGSVTGGLFLDHFLAKRGSFRSFIRQYGAWMLSFGLGVVLVLLWSGYINLYNQQYHNSYFLTQTAPIWKVSPQFKAEVFDYVGHYWWDSYYPKPVFYVFGVLILAGLIAYKKAEKWLYFTSVLAWLGMGLYFILFFAQFKDHDYYFMLVSFAFFTSAFNGVLALYNLLPNRWVQGVLALTLSGFAISSYIQVKDRIEYRYNLPDNLYYTEVYNKLHHSEAFLQKAGVDASVPVIVMVDHARNTGLFALRRYGWPIYGTSQQEFERLESLASSESDKACLVLTGDSLLQKTQLQPFLGQKLGSENGVSIFRFADMYRERAAQQRRQRP